MSFTTSDRTNHNLRVDDDGTNTVGTLWNKAEAGKTYDDIDATLAKLAKCQVFNNGTQSIASGSFVALTFNAEDFDDGAMHSTAANTSRITIPAGMGGIYLVGGGTFFAANATGVRQARITKNGSATPVISGDLRAAFSISGTGPSVSVQGLLSLAAGDFIEIEVSQDSGGALNVGAAGAAHNYTQSAFYAARLL